MQASQSMYSGVTLTDRDHADEQGCLLFIYIPTGLSLLHRQHIYRHSLLTRHFKTSGACTSPKAEGMGVGPAMRVKQQATFRRVCCTAANTSVTAANTSVTCSIVNRLAMAEGNRLPFHRLFYVHPTQDDAGPAVSATLWPDLRARRGTTRNGRCSTASIMKMVTPCACYYSQEYNKSAPLLGG